MGVPSRFYSNPGLTHIELVKHILQYVSDTLELGLRFNEEANILDDVIGYIDSDFARSKIDQESTGRYVFILVRAVISHLSKLQLIVGLSICEIKYVAICEAGKKAV